MGHAYAPGEPLMPGDSFRERIEENSKGLLQFLRDHPALTGHHRYELHEADHRDDGRVDAIDVEVYAVPESDDDPVTMTYKELVPAGIVRTRLGVYEIERDIDEDGIREPYDDVIAGFLTDDDRVYWGRKPTDDG